MTWLYTLVFTGLFISSAGELGTINSYEPINTAVPEVAAQRDEIEKFEQSYPLSANGRVSVSNINGSIEVVAWDRSEVKLEVTKIANTRDVLADAEIKVDARQDHFSVETDYKDKVWGRDRWEKDRKLEVNYKLSVPRTAVLDEIETVNGSVNAANFVNVTKISTVNGSVDARNLRGKADLSTVNGTVNADFDELAAGSKVELSTVNGQVNLLIPSNANATIKADSVNGGITNDFGLPVRKGEYVGRDLHGRLGTGEVQIKLDSVNGRLAINKKNDGKPSSPATNLLSPDRSTRSLIDRETRAESARVNAEVRRTVNEARKANVDAIREANRELQKIKIPELENFKIDIGELDFEVPIAESLKKAQAQLQDAMFFVDTPVVERKTNSFSVEGTPKVVIEAQNCSVRVRGWDKNEVKYVLTEYQDVRVPGHNVKVSETTSKREVMLKVTGDHGLVNSRTPRLEIYVPRKADLKIKTQGEIRLEGVSGELDLTGSENSIDVRGADGRLKVANTAGIVRVVDFKGEVIAKTCDGDVYLDGNFDRIDATAGEGSFIVTIPADSDADLSVSDDRLSFAGIEAKKNSDGTHRIGKGGRRYTFNSEDGSVELRSRDIVNSER